MTGKTGIAAVLSLIAGTCSAGGLDRSGTPVDIIFEQGTYAEIAYGHFNPNITGTDITGARTGSVAGVHGVAMGGIKTDIHDSLSIALFYDQPYGSEIRYGASSPLLGGTRARADSDGVTVLLRYRFNDNVSVHGGPRLVRADADVALRGLGYGAANGYRVRFGSNTGAGFVAGAAYERPDIALRVALTYHSRVGLSLPTTERVPVPGAPGVLATVESGKTRVHMPQSVELSARTGITRSTLLFGSVRWQDWSALDTTPALLGANLTDLKDIWTFKLGVAQEFTDRFSGSLSFIYEPVDGDRNKSPLAPNNGYYSIALGGKYKLTEKLSLSAGIRYYWIGGSTATVQNRELARFRNNDLIAFGTRLSYRF